MLCIDYLNYEIHSLVLSSPPAIMSCSDAIRILSIGAVCVDGGVWGNGCAKLERGAARVGDYFWFACGAVPTCSENCLDE